MKILIVSRQRLFAEVVARALQADAPDIEARVVTTLDDACEQTSGELTDVVLVDDELLAGAELGHVETLFNGVRTVLVSTSDTPVALAAARRLGCSQVIGRGARLADVRAALRSTSTGMGMIGMTASPGGVSHRGSGPAFGLTPREMQVLRMLTLGADNAGIARTLAISQNTVRTHVQNIFTKLGVSSRLAAATLAIHSGTIPPEPATIEESIGLARVVAQDEGLEQAQPQQDVEHRDR